MARTQAGAADGGNHASATNTVASTRSWCMLILLSGMSRPPLLLRHFFCVHASSTSNNASGTKTVLQAC